MQRIVEKDAINSWTETIATVKLDSKHARLWKEAGRMATKPRRDRVAVNLNKLDKAAKDGEFLVVPGKVLSFGKVSHKFKIAAVEYSQSAEEKLKKGGCEIVATNEMLKKENPRLIV
ncbi:MAG: 50S ribosomal protein L18e [Candidatus Micrarchaeota archaeon]|nr:50S ribosomal protein L18e [Candidatus Micrarchaeota archaeon]MDE1847794.1 50S ribosomal protein L18e [Candidatus Micrarchaeota archaeon]MDE1864232.1 50S ribosomal protein L18e [Candidatus Micrarchaeota archaeon]